MVDEGYIPDEAYDHFTYIVTVRETVDAQYEVIAPRAMTVDEIELLKTDLARDTTPDVEVKRLGFTANVRNRQIADVKFIGKKLKSED